MQFGDLITCAIVGADAHIGPYELSTKLHFP